MKSVLTFRIPTVQALKEKELGNAAYKKKEFETALIHYNKAIELNPNEITLYTNIAGNFLS
jgi:stress-induced-phosphoprotein 1